MDLTENKIEWNKTFQYDPESPTFLTNLITRSPKAKAGAPAGCYGSKEIKTNVGGKFYRNARIIWEMHNGPIPEGKVMKFKDGNEFNLLIENLSIQSRRERGVNSKQHTGRSGLRGIREFNGRWRVTAKVSGSTIHLGTYGSIEDAKAARAHSLKLVKG